MFLRNSLSLAFVSAFQGSAKFYSQALQNFEKEPEIAYLHLISAGEILSNFHEFNKLDLLDDETNKYLGEIRLNIANGEKIARHIENRLLLIKKRFVETIIDLIDDDFFDKSESKRDFGRFTPDNFRKAIASAYDLRSKYVHTGAPFGGWMSLQIGGQNIEVPLGKPNVADKDLAKILEFAPTLVGLERVVRYCLVKFAERHGAYAQSNPSESNV